MPLAHRSLSLVILSKNILINSLPITFHLYTYTFSLKVPEGFHWFSSRVVINHYVVTSNLWCFSCLLISLVIHYRLLSSSLRYFYSTMLNNFNPNWDNFAYLFITMKESSSIFLENKALCYSSFVPAAIVIAYIFHKYYKTKKLVEKTPANVVKSYPLINEVFFFSEKYALCSLHQTYESVCDSSDCGLLKLKKIIAYLDSATTSLDVCVYAITSYKLAQVILKKFKEGIRVRVITDEGMAGLDGSQIASFRKKSIPVRARQSTQFYMHHKFAIVDRRLLMNGSFNWTSQATFGNWENLHIHNNPDVVQKYCEEFDRLWSLWL